MKSIAVLACNSSISSDVLGILDYFEFCNELWRRLQKQTSSALFHAYLVSPDNQPLQLKPGVQLAVQSHNWQRADAIILPAVYCYDRASLEQAIEHNQPYFASLRLASRDGVLLAASCTGTYLLAATGLLDHRQATSSWFFKDIFQQLFPAVHLMLNRLVVQDENLITAGATTAYYNLCIALTDRLAGEQFARQMAKLMLTEPNRQSQLPYMDLNLQPVHNDQLVLNIQKHLQYQLAQPFVLQQLAEQFHLTKRTLLRRFKAAVNDTPLNYLQRLRVEQAKRLLETTNLPVEQIVLQVGYEDASSFRKLFQQYTELTPSQYRQKFMRAEDWQCCPV